ncbi:MAG: hypothetical protein HYR95_02325 [Candidatus Colwellbacteria bacterium]|nr:hypothetical protein [Candidatus Colwellbacteria bacterium]MBI3273966.1 hypothetical protein [Candidatus Colwellbacteria bacterium]
MLFGHKNLVNNFKRLADCGRLAHGYIFFGEAQVGKSMFAKCLANYLEYGFFEEPKKYLNETLIIGPNDSGGKSGIGIDVIRDIKRFLFALPAKSNFRIAIIDDAQTLTSQAQNAILKIAEEPPASGLIVLITPNPETIIPTLQSRFQKVYFPRASSVDISEYLIKELNIGKAEASKIAGLSFGRIGRAKNLAVMRDNDMNEIVNRFLKAKSGNLALIKDIVDNVPKLNSFLEALISNLGNDVQKNYPRLKSIMRTITLMSQFNLNKRLQLEASLIWNI